MARLQFTAWHFLLGVAMLACLAGITAVFVFVSPDFGFGNATIPRYFS
jgi:hypothetical protein